MLIIHGSAGIENSDSLASEETLRTAWFRSPVVYTREAEAHGQTAEELQSGLELKPPTNHLSRW